MGRIRQSSDFNVSVSYSIVVYFSISPEHYKIWTWYLVFWCPAVQWKKTKSYSFALLVKLKGATSCILMSHAFGSSTAAPKCHQNAMICFKARLLMRSAYATKDSSRTWKTSIQRKVYWDVLSTEIASAFELCVVRKISSHHSHFSQRVSTLDWAENRKGMSCVIGSSVWLLPSPISRNFIVNYK